MGDVLAKLGPEDGLVLDPWNGSGTTTAVARQLGIRASGFDLNPALVVIANGRLLGKDVAPSIAPLARDILSHAQSLTSEQVDSHPDPLATWFDEATTCPWLYGEYESRGCQPRADPIHAKRCLSLADLEAELGRYAAYLRRCGLSPGGIPTYVIQARLFVTWLPSSGLPGCADA